MELRVLANPGAERWDGALDRPTVPERLHSSPEGGRRVQLETGTPGTGRIVPTPGAEGPFRFGEPAELRILGGASGVLSAFEIDDPVSAPIAERG